MAHPTQTLKHQVPTTRSLHYKKSLFDILEGCIKVYDEEVQSKWYVLIKLVLELVFITYLSLTSILIAKFS